LDESNNMKRLFAILGILAIGIALGAVMSQAFPAARAVLEATGLLDLARPHQREAEPVGTASASKGAADHAEDGLVRMTPERISADEIDVTPVGEGSLARKLIVPGTVVPNADRIARVPVKVVGTVAQLRKRLGDLVTEGEVVALIDSREVADARSEYLTALVNFDLQKTMFERAQQLWNQKISAEQQYLQARATFAQAQLRFDLARQKLSALDLDASELADAAKKDAVSPGALNLRQYQIRSPVSGRVVERRVDQGMAVGQEGNPSDLYTVADLSSVWVELAVPAPDLDAIKQGQRVVISSGNNGNKEEGRIMFVSPLLNQETRSARVIAEIDNKSLIWRPGLFVTAEILIGEERVDLRIPRVALQTINGKKVAFVRTPEGFQKRDLKIGIVDEEFVEVTNGLVPHERIAISNTFLIKAELGKAEAGHDE
jgi:cobalt-zinc-cadmium efflux system membrane fusion protein